MKIRKIVFIVLLTVSGTPQLLAQQDAEPSADDTQKQKTAQLTLDDLRTFTDVFNQVRRNYVEEVDDRTLLDSAIRGMLSELDPHSSFLPEPEYKELDDNARGRYSGIGIDVRKKDQQLVVKAIIDDSPADQAGINPGDIITSINGVPVKGRKLSDAMDELLGDPGTDVVLLVLPPEGDERELKITRKYIQVPTLSFRLLDKSYGYFQISHFHKESAIDLEQSLESIRNDGTILRGLVIDLRDNPGGVLQQAVSMADGFLDEGLIVSTRGRNSTMQLEFSAHPGQWIPEIPLIVIVDRGTASASEVLAGALQDNGRALIIGERTFGKGSVQSVLPLRNGTGIKLTTARYFTPSGRSIQAEGIHPDVVIDSEDTGATAHGRIREADLERHLDQDPDDLQARSRVTGEMDENFAFEEALGVLREAGIIAGGNQTVEEAVVE